MIERGELAITKTGTHRRLALGDVVAYQELRKNQQHRHLEAIAALDRDLSIDDL